MSSISVPVWFVTPGGGWVRRGALEPHEPGSTRRYVAEELGLNPDDYGIPKDRPFDEKELD